jgi:hypothetical protein
MPVPDFVPPDFVPPERLETPQFVLEPLGPEHNERDHAAWSSSIDHIRGTPGWRDAAWPYEKTLQENLEDLRAHARDFRERTGFTYTVLEPEGGDVVGCVYIYPLEDEGGGAWVASWVRASRAEVDEPLWREVSAWLERDWPFERVDYAPRHSPR